MHMVNDIIYIQTMFKNASVFSYEHLQIMWRCQSNYYYYHHVLEVVCDFIHIKRL